MVVSRELQESMQVLKGVRESRWLKHLLKRGLSIQCFLLLKQHFSLLLNITHQTLSGSLHSADRLIMACVCVCVCVCVCLCVCVCPDNIPTDWLLASHG